MLQTGLCCTDIFSTDDRPAAGPRGNILALHKIMLALALDHNYHFSALNLCMRAVTLYSTTHRSGAGGGGGSNYFD
jgi:hypothetical protein